MRRQPESTRRRQAGRNVVPTRIGVPPWPRRRRVLLSVAGVNLPACLRQEGRMAEAAAEPLKARQLRRQAGPGSVRPAAAASGGMRGRGGVPGLRGPAARRGRAPGGGPVQRGRRPEPRAWRRPGTGWCSAVDRDPEAVETHRHHFGGLALDWDLGDAGRVAEVAELVAAAGVELLAGGPPCQPFSKAGRSKIRHRVRHGLR